MNRRFTFHGQGAFALVSAFFLLMMLHLTSLCFSQGKSMVASQIPNVRQYTLEKFMQDFQQRYNVYYSYKTTDLKELAVSANELGDDPDASLKRTLASVGLTFEKINDVYFIERIRQETTISRQEWEVRGTVTDSSGLPLPGVDRKSVVKGKSVSVRVDLGGRRNIKKKK